MKEFLVVAQRMNFTAAAKYLNLTQSSVSKHISALENELGCTLFRRSAAGIELTQQGRVLVTDARKILDMIENTKNQLATAKAGITVGASDDDAVVRLLSDTTARMVKKDPSFIMSVEKSTLQPLMVLLLSGHVDLCIQLSIESEKLNPRCESCLAAIVPMVAIMTKDHKLANEETISVHDLQGQYVIHPIGGDPEFSRGIDIVDDFFLRHQVTVGQKLLFANTTRDFSFFNLGENVLVTARSNFSRRLFPNLDNYRAVPIVEPDAVFTYELVWKKDETDPEILMFKDTVLEVSNEIYPLNFEERKIEDEIRSIKDQYRRGEDDNYFLHP
ncbi:MAG: LysR family transcriptional regulator [Eggerthellaceae bacterium]|nr:LysR family transcriptional regulator [Eggerthellaceae bacterium]